ncbi:unnamed protein product [Euphydryas editha]|uniref:Distal membrane-arm assembly complex protein 1-like domain-containing protein n=1 Tax=Euphydryas editha TaxID=104508 RepID=A0AAU9U0Z3_EUPED|nr:unnamed protein product [Euphydryas editha]
MTTVVENRPPDCTACRIFSSIGLVGIGAYLANAAFKNTTLPGKIVVSTFSFAFVTLGVQRYKQQYPFNKHIEKS